MIEISPLEDNFSEKDWPLRANAPLPSSEKIGRILLAGSFCFTACCFVPIRKRRIAAAPLPAFSPQPQVSQEAKDANLEISLPVLPASSFNQDSKPSYADLHCTAEDQKKIGWIITTIAQGGIDLIWKRQKLDEVGEEILPVHPYKFLTTILLDPILRNCLKQIFNDPFLIKKKGFLGGVKRGMEREAANLETYIHEFAAELGTTAEAIRPLMRAGDWNALVVHLLEKVPKQMHRTFQA